MKSILEQKKTSEYKFIIENYTIIFKEKLKKGEDLEIDLDKIVIYYKGKKSDNINYFIADTLKFNLTKHKYVPHIELVNAPEDIEISKIAKIKNNDPLIKFYGFNKDSVCKITYKSNKINNVKLYFNYRLII
jgi:DNA-directed RNA polymerase subunit H (RpoH/RPB5)